MTNLDKTLKEIKSRCEAATEGPWSPSVGESVITDKQRTYFTAQGPEHYTEFLQNEAGIMGRAEKDAVFIAHARTDVPMLLEMIDMLTPKECWCDNELMLQCEECTTRSKIRKIAEKYR